MAKKCMLTECNRVEQTRRGYCKRHYYRLMTHGDPEKVARVHRTTPVLERFKLIGWTETDKGLPEPCWEWNGNCSSDKDGYGTMGVFGVRHRAHRLSYETFVGPIPKGHLVRHKCDNPPCINPLHLETGTVKQNTQDMLDRGRHVPPRGERNGGAILDTERVIELYSLRDSGRSRGEVGKEFGVSASTVYSIWKGHRWTHVTGGIANE